MTIVSVVMGAYNAEAYIGEAIESILSQTVRDFEFIVVDDGSTDRTAEILDSFHDPRIVRVRNDGNIGLTRSLNRGLRLAQGRYIARLDADDISLPQRLERQVRFLEQHPRVGLVGGAVRYIDPNGAELGTQRVPTGKIHQALLDLEFCWWHSTTAFRRECLETVGLYREHFKYAQDYDLWLRIAEAYPVASLRQPAVKLRLRPESISVANRAEQRAYVKLAVELARERASTGRDRLEAQTDSAGLVAGALPSLSSKELGKMLVRAACLNYLLGRVADGKEALCRAIDSDPTLAEETDRLLRLIVYHGFNYATAPTSRQGAIQYLNRVFANLPPAAETLRGHRHRAIGQLYAISAFESYEMSHWLQVLVEVPRAVFYDPAWLKERGMWSIFRSALVGGKDCDRHRIHPAST